MKEREKGKTQTSKEGRELFVQTVIVLAAFGILMIGYAAFYSQRPINVFSVTGNANAVQNDSLQGNAATPANGGAEQKPPVSDADDSEEGEQEVLVEKSVDINTAEESELDKLPGIGPTLAKRIVEYREENGDFVDIEELMDVDGIGKKTFEELQDYIIAR